jgi:hypothetical protein
MADTLVAAAIVNEDHLEAIQRICLLLERSQAREGHLDAVAGANLNGNVRTHDSSSRCGRVEFSAKVDEKFNLPPFAVALAPGSSRASPASSPTHCSRAGFGGCGQE